MRITAKGQVTIPAHIRAKAGLQPNTDVEFIHDRHGVRIVKAKRGRRPSRGDEVVRRLEGTAKVSMTTDQILALMRGD
jgi:AbrB family looped-hinge helix DNA binding protein